LEQKLQEISQNSFGITYTVGIVALEGAVVDLHIGTTLSINSSALKVACPRRELERKFEINLWAENTRIERKSSSNES
jgi:hypothetical protein